MAEDFLSATDFPPSTEPLVPSGAKARVRANIAAIEMVHTLHDAQRPATPAEQRVLAAWSGWGAVPQVFDPRDAQFDSERARLRELLSREQYRHAEASILNAHYTDPALVRVIWDALHTAGFSGGRVLEPGCGSGTFIGHAPQSAVMVGVENDDITAQIASLLYPSAQIRHEGFETTRVPEHSFAAAVGNVPFGRYSVTDPAHNPRRHSIHNHCILKALALTAPGGYVAVLTSRYTMDSVKPAARQDMAAKADLIAALRLPSKAFSRVAGTDVVTDLLVFHRRDPDEREAATETPEWVNTIPVVLTDADTGASEQVPVNAYFHHNREHVLGQMQLGHGLHGSHQLTVVGQSGAQLADQLHAALQPLMVSAVQRGQALSATADSLTNIAADLFDPGLVTAADRGPDTPLFTLRYNDTTKGIEYWAGHSWQPRKTAAARIGETRELIALRDVANSLIASQRDGRPQAEREQLRAHLNRLYDTYVGRHGPINRFTWVRPTVTQATHDKRVATAEAAWREQEGEPDRPYDGAVPPELAEQWDTDAWEAPASYKKRAHLDGGLRHDPGWAVVAALEIFDEDTGAAHKAPIFSTDLLTAAADPVTADTPEEALAISLERTGRVDVDLIGALLEVGPTDTRALLAGLVYPSLADPDELVPAAAALSGNVRTKLAQAQAAAEHDPTYDDYVRALKEVVPPDRSAEDITVRPGAPWIPPTLVAKFAEESFGATRVGADHIAGRWFVDVDASQRYSRLMTEEWGLESKGCDAVSLLDAVCNSRAVVVTDDDGIVNAQATFAAQAKCAKITEEFARWLWSDEQRRDELMAEYNRRFNSLRAPRYDGTHLRLPGLSNHFTPHPYQRDAVARILAEPTVLLDHVVGAGKTGSMVMAAMELRRLGLVKQPWIVVPNHIIEQVGREAKQWYPAAKVLLGSAATTAEGRRSFIAQTAASQWDMVIVPQSAFTAIGVSDDVRIEYQERQLATLQEQYESSTVERSKKAIERAIKSAKERLERLTNQTRKDTGLKFEHSGADYLLIDEAHMYKNKQRVCNIEELSCPKSSERAEDLAMKLAVLRQRRRDEARARGIPEDQIVERVATFATGTPIANSLGELWVMQQYLRPDLLEAAGVADLGDWGAAFTATVTTVEVNATGTRLRPVTRVGKYTNLPELVALSAAYTDVVTRDQVPVNLPVLRTGQRKIITIQPDIEVTDFIADLGYRADHLDPQKPQRDNVLKISNDGRNASLDPRLAHLGTPTNSRAAVVAGEAMRIHNEFAERRYRDPHTNETMALPGALQIMFCDRGTPKADGQFSIYHAIKDELIERGMPAERIRFVHEARKPAELKALFAQCIRGEVSVLIGSTEKMGTGTNVQDRAAALHHVDVPWRPADLEQREGRIMRQGNQNDEIEILNYVTESTYDTVMWQKVQAKALFIEQMRRNEVIDNEIEDLSGGDIGAAAAETKAIATGDPRYLRQVQLDDDVKRLTALERAHRDSVRRRDFTVTQLERSIPAQRARVDELAPIAERAAQHIQSEQPARITIGETTYRERPPAAQAFTAACQRAYIGGKDRGASQFSPLGATINGIEILAARDLTHDQLLLRLDVASRTVEIDHADLLAATDNAAGAKQLGLLRRVENLYADLPRHHARLQRDADNAQTHLDDLLANPPDPFEHSAELDAKKAELDALTLELRMAAESPEAKAKAAAAEQRMRQRGREPGWSLLLNPTPAVVEEAGFPTPEALRRAVRSRERIALAEYEQQRQRDIDGPDNGVDEGIDEP